MRVELVLHDRKAVDPKDPPTVSGHVNAVPGKNDVIEIDDAIYMVAQVRHKLLRLENELVTTDVFGAHDVQVIARRTYPEDVLR